MQNILIVDDDEAVRRLLYDILVKHGYTCRMAGDAAEARGHLGNNRYELVMTDLQMPGESGMDFIRFVRKAYPDTAVLIVSVIDDIETARRAISMNLSGYIVKPVDSSQILITVENALRLRKYKLKEKAYQAMLEQTVQQRTLELQDLVRELETAYQEKEDAVKQLQEQLFFIQTLMDAIPSPIFYKDRQGRYSGCNKTFEAYSGVPKDQIAGKTVYDIAPPDLAEIYHTADMRLIQEPGKQVYESAVRFANGDMHDVVFNKATYRNQNGDVAGIVGVILDITERKILEQKLVQAHKLESIGQLAAGIAHEINTPIQYIRDNVRFLEGGFEDFTRIMAAVKPWMESVKTGEPAKQWMDEIEAAVKDADLEYLFKEIPLAISQSMEGLERVNRIVRAVQDFSHPGADKMLDMDLRKSIESAIILSRNEWKSVADVETDFDPSLQYVRCLPVEMNQVFLNVIVNAAHAIGEVMKNENREKGKITISTRRKDTSAEICFSDTGCGISEAAQYRIFDPFFTTKPVGKGTGLGMNIAYRTITVQHKGSLDFITEKGKGTTFIITLPLVEKTE